MEHEHTHDAIRQRVAVGPRQSYLRDWVYGGIDGTVTTFAIVSGVVGAHLSASIILILGSASLIADGFAMAAGNYLATRAEHEEFRYAGQLSAGTSTLLRMENGKRSARFCEDDSGFLMICWTTWSRRSQVTAIAGCA
jgi:hypothetical protein